MEENSPEIPEYINEMIKSGKNPDEIRIDQEGNWLVNGITFDKTNITDRKIIKFFNKSIDKTKDGIYIIHYNNFIYPIVVEDTPFFITGVLFEGTEHNEKVYLSISNEKEEELDVDTLHFKKNNCLYCYVMNKKYPARFKRSPAFHILDRLDESDDTYFLNICGKRIVLTEKVEND